MNAADKAIEEIRTVRHRISAAYGHDIEKYLAHLRELERANSKQIKAYEQSREHVEEVKLGEVTRDFRA